MASKKRRLDHRQIDFDTTTKPDLCAACDQPDNCGAGRVYCCQTGEFVAGPLKGKLPCEVQGAPVWFKNAHTEISCQ